jgi:hypothetical protein
MWISKVGIGKPMGVVATCFWGRRKDVAFMKASVREELEYFRCRYMQAHINCVCVGVVQGREEQLEDWWKATYACVNGSLGSNISESRASLSTWRSELAYWQVCKAGRYLKEGAA